MRLSRDNARGVEASRDGQDGGPEGARGLMGLGTLSLPGPPIGTLWDPLGLPCRLWEPGGTRGTPASHPLFFTRLQSLPNEIIKMGYVRLNEKVPSTQHVPPFTDR